MYVKHLSFTQVLLSPYDIAPQGWGRNLQGHPHVSSHQTLSHGNTGCLSGKDMEAGNYEASLKIQVSNTF